VHDMEGLNAQMRAAPLHVFVEAMVFLVLCLVAIGSFGYAAWKWWDGVEASKLPVWRQVATMLAFLAAATQVSVLGAFWIWPQIGHDYVGFARWARWILPPFLVALPSAIAGKRAVRWLLLTASVVVFVICFFIVLSA
jgi:hypothetical protein